MRFGVVSYENKYLNLDGMDKQNLGDWIQMLAIEYLYQEWNIKDYQRIGRNTAAQYQGEYLVVPWNGVLFDMNCNRQWHNTFPFSNKIIPVFFSVYYHGMHMRDSSIQYFKNYSPIGCRDEFTMELMRSNGIKSYLSGCVTALFPRRIENKERQKEVMLVDAPKGIEQYMPEHLRTKIVYGTNLFPVRRVSGEHYMTTKESQEAYECAKYNLRYWSDNAKLVVTSRLHVAIPCVAMGIPVILVKKQFDERFSWVERLIHPYCIDEWNSIDWEPEMINYETEKAMMRNTLYKQLMETYQNNKDILTISEFYENRNRTIYNKMIRNALIKLSIQTDKFINCQYAIWGVTAEAVYVIRTIKELAKTMELVKAYDIYVEGKVEGLQIEKPSAIDLKNDLIYFIFSRAAREDARKLFDKNHIKYVFVDIDNEGWECNF